MKTYGYARVSSTGQSLEIQEGALKQAKCDLIRSEKLSGTSTTKREQLQILLAFIGNGDTLVVTRIDRLARSVKDLQDIVHALHAKGAALKVLEQPIDTTTSAGKLFFDMLGAFAEFETAVRKERQMEGIAKAKQNGVYGGRKSSISRDEVSRLTYAGRSVADIARALQIARQSVHNIQAELGLRSRPNALTSLLD